MLEEIGAGDVEQIRVYNKIDAAGLPPQVAEASERRSTAVWLSALTGDGLDLLRTVLSQRFREDHVRGTLRLGAAEGAERARLFDEGAVVEERYDDNGDCWLDIDMTAKDFMRLCRQTGLAPERLIREDAPGAQRASR